VEQFVFGGGKEAVQEDGVLADAEVGIEGDDGADGQLLAGGGRHEDAVADPLDVEEAVLVV
jgi:hypothetical protein